MKPYTYLIKFKPTGQVYYGSRSKNVRLGLNPTQDLMVKYFTSCKPLKKLIKKYGLSSFEWEIRRTFDTAEKASLWEQKVLRRCKVLHDPKWFNQNIAGYIVPTSDGLKKISAFHKNKPKSKEHKKKISAALKKYKRTAEHTINLSKAHKGQIPWNKGIPATEEQKLKQSKTMKGRPSKLKGTSLLDATKRKISETKHNNPFLKTAEFKEKMRHAQKLAVESRLRNKKKPN